MNRNHAIALIQYISRAHQMIPTTGAEWEIIREALTVIENVANGRTELVERQPSPQEVTNAASKREATPSNARSS
jgi:hypothetical protein